MLLVLLLAAFCGLGYRLVDLQVMRHGELKVRAQANTQREFLFEPRRGDILDARGNLLATSTSVKIVCADPTLIGDRQRDVARVLAPFLQMDAEQLAEKMMPRVFRNSRGELVTNAYVRLKTRVPVETWEEIRAALSRMSFGVDEKSLSDAERAFYNGLRKRAIFAEDYPIRVYPNQTLAAHVLGFTTTSERKIDRHVLHEITGREGIEATMNSKLKGVPGWRLTETDGRGREIVALREQDVEPRDGLNVVLTIDSVIQHILETELAQAMEDHRPISVSGLVIRPATGEILAMATLPTFDPNNPGAFSADARRNRIILDVEEPGSTFKIVVVSGALNDGLTRLDDMIDCENGRFAFGGRVLHDHHAYRVLSVLDVIARSSNIGAAKIGIRLGARRLCDYIAAFGFGEKTGIPLNGEVRGIVHTPESSAWSKVTIAQIPMGHGIAVTRLQMAMAMCAIANEGRLMRPMLVSRLEDADGNVVGRYSPQFVRQVVSRETAQQMVQALKSVVTTNGTAPRAALEHYTVAGKTGTAQKVENGTYARGKYVSSFIGFFPADRPELCISIVLDEPKEGYYGGSVAAPVFRRVAERVASYLNVRPDSEENPMLQDAMVRAGDPSAQVP